MSWRRALAAVIVFAAAGCSAQSSPVGIANRIYGDCIKARLMVERSIEPTRVGIIEFVERTDDWCLPWTLVWTQALANIDFFQRSDVLTAFQASRLRLLQRLADELRDEALLSR